MIDLVIMNEQELKEFYNNGLLAFEKQNYDYAIDIFSQIISDQYDHLEARHYLPDERIRKAVTAPRSDANPH